MSWCFFEGRLSQYLAVSQTWMMLGYIYYSPYRSVHSLWHCRTESRSVCESVVIEPRPLSTTSIDMRARVITHARIHHHYHRMIWFIPISWSQISSRCYGVSSKMKYNNKANPQCHPKLAIQTSPKSKNKYMYNYISRPTYINVCK